MDANQQAENKVKKMLEEIYKKALEELDTKATFHHYLAFGNIKLIWKKNER
jgi:hypothetical protein